MSPAIGILLAITLTGLLYSVLDQVMGSAAFERKRLFQRIDSLGGVRRSTLTLEKKDQFSVIKQVNTLLARFKFAQKVSILLQMSGWKINPSVYLLVSLLISAVLYNVLIRAGYQNLHAILVSILCFHFLPIMVLKTRQKRYIKLFGKHFPKALQIIRGALNAGLGLNTAFEQASRDGMYPVNREFSNLLKQLNLGKGMEDVLSDLRERIPSKDVESFSTAIEVQQESGGSLVDVMQNIEESINTRAMIHKEMSALTGQAVMTGWIICLLPFAIMGIQFVMNREYLMLLFTESSGHKVLAGTAVIYGIGLLVIKKIVSIKIVA